MRRQTLKHHAEFGAFRVAAALSGVLPERVAHALAGLLGSVAGSVLRIRRTDVDKHLQTAFPDATPGWRTGVARASYGHFAREAVATLRLSGASADDVRRRTTVHGLKELNSALDEGRGAIVITGHLGNWEIGGASLAARGVPIDAVVFPQNNPLFDQYLTDARARLGVTVIAKADARWGVPESLRKGRVVALMADQNIRTRPVFVDYFGVPAATAKGPAVFALRTCAPVFLGISLREPGWPPRYRVLFERVPVARTGMVNSDVLALTRAHVALLEEHVRCAPEQYFWLHRRWKTRPPRVSGAGGQEPPSEVTV
ncbi:MAG: lysophospholipid acyltransferase family protein [Gemmatimonadota bacterium]|nr:MAG: lysophospholipid acyltransferase family protein [Gemmatimonadota bacterium]